MKNSQSNLKKSLALLICLLSIPAIQAMNGVQTRSLTNSNRNTQAPNGTNGHNAHRCPTCNDTVERPRSCMNCQLFPLPQAHPNVYREGVEGCAKCMILAPNGSEIPSEVMTSHVLSVHAEPGMFACRPCGIKFPSAAYALYHCKHGCPSLPRGQRPHLICTLCYLSSTHHENIFLHECPNFTLKGPF